MSCVVHVKDDMLHLRAIYVIFIGYKTRVNGYKLWDQNVNLVVVIHDVSFDKASLMKLKKSTRGLETSREHF